jgi:hypothetical protein
LSLLGGGNAKEMVKRFMSEVVSNELALQLNWAGRTGWKRKDDTFTKRAFSSTKLCATVIRKYLECISSISFDKQKTQLL